MKLGEGGKTLIISHQNADADSIGSVYFLSRRYNGTVLLPNGPDRVGKKLLEFLNLEVKDPSSVEMDDYDRIVVVDTPTPEQLLPIELPDEGTTIIDHHDTNSWDEEVFYKNRTSCAEIVFELIGAKDLTRKEAVALGSGIITDTSGLKRARSDTLTTLAQVLELGDIDLPEIFDIIYHDRNYSENVCRLKGAERLSFREVNGYLVAWTKVGSFESSVSNSLIALGADVAFTGSQRGGDLLISARSKNGLMEKGLDLGSVVKELTEDIDRLNGGGHPGAAVLKGQGDVDRMITELVDRVSDWVREKRIERKKV